MARAALWTLSASLLLGLPPAAAQDVPPAPAPAPAAEAREDAPSDRERKIRHLLEIQGIRHVRRLVIERMTEGMKASVKGMPKGYAERFLRLMEESDFESRMVAILERHLNNETLDAAIAFYDSEEGRKMVRALPEIMKENMDEGLRLGRELGMRAFEEAAAADPDWVSPNEGFAVATLRYFVRCQEQLQATGSIDTDSDGTGEFGTLLKLSGSAPVRNGFRPGAGKYQSTDFRWATSDYSKTGRTLNPPILAEKYGAVDENGILIMSGYCFRIFLPDGAGRSGFVHETGPRAKPGLAGGTSTVGVDHSEVIWCAYAWPEKLGANGKRVFWVSNAGDAVRSENARARWEGTSNPVSPDAAYRDAGCTAQIAVGTVGRDGDVWRIAE